MSDEELDEVVKDIKKDFCQSGYRMVLGVLLSRGYRIQQRRVMESLRRVDVEGVIMRSLQLKIIHRREYRVYGPNALWHIDTNHKLIRLESEVQLKKGSQIWSFSRKKIYLLIGRFKIHLIFSLTLLYFASTGSFHKFSEFFQFTALLDKLG